MKVAVTSCVAGLMIAAAVPTHLPEQRFAEAQEIFDAAKDAMDQVDADALEVQRQFHDAATRFAALARDGIQSVNLYVNTGNAYHFAGDDARALLWYLRAHGVSNTPETRHGLIALRNACGAEPWPPEHGSIGRALMFWHYDLPRRVKHWILVATYPLGSLMIIVALFRRRRTIWPRLGIAFMLVGAAMGVSDLAAAVDGDGGWAVVLEDGRGYAGDGEGYSIVVDHIRPGQEVKVIEPRHDWVHVELPSGTTCWLRAEICEPI